MTLDLLRLLQQADYFLGLFNDANGTEYHTSTNERGIDESERMWSSRGLLEVVSRSFPEGTEEDHEEPQLTQVGCWPRIEPVPFRIQVYSSNAKPGRLL
jgi:hypothetical protein